MIFAVLEKNCGFKDTYKFDAIFSPTHFTTLSHSESAKVHNIQCIAGHIDAEEFM